MLLTCVDDVDVVEKKGDREIIGESASVFVWKKVGYKGGVERSGETDKMTYEWGNTMWNPENGQHNRLSFVFGG